MFTRYEYKAGSTAANVVADVVKLLTGTTDKTLLSADCVQAPTIIINDGVARPAGWTEWDAAAGTNARGIRAPNFDGSTYKYVVVAHNNSTIMNFKLYESWNATAHTGTNLAYYSDLASANYGSTVNLALGGALFISSSARSIVFFGFVNGLYDSPQIVAEHSRDEIWDTPANNYPPTVFITGSSLTAGSGYYPYKPRIRNYPGNDAISSNASVMPISAYGGVTVTSQPISPTTKVRDAANNPVHAFVPVSLMSNGTTGVYISREPQTHGKVFDIFLTTQSYGTTGDEVSFNGNVYFIAASGTVRIAVPKF